LNAGYILSKLKERQNGLIAQLVLGGPPCNLFGKDVANLSIEVSYETKSRCAIYAFSFESLTWRFNYLILGCTSKYKTLKINSTLFLKVHLNDPYPIKITKKETRI